MLKIVTITFVLVSIVACSTIVDWQLGKTPDYKTCNHKWVCSDNNWYVFRERCFCKHCRVPKSYIEQKKESRYMDKKRISAILNQNSEKGFVQRILNPAQYPTLDLGDGNTATHMMSWGQLGDKYVVYPTVLYNGKQLNRYDADAAWQQVSKSGNFIEFDNAEEAEQFSMEYKKYWESE